MLKKFRKTAAALTAAVMLMSTAAYADYGAVITDLKTDGGVTMTVNKTDAVSARAIAAVYNADGTLYKALFAENDIAASETGEISRSFGNIEVPEGGYVKGFLWKTDADGNLTLEPLAAAYSPSAEETESTTAPTNEPSETENPTGDGKIHLEGDRINADGVENVTVDGSTVTITAAGDYIITGSLDDGQIITADTLTKDDNIQIELDGVTVNCSTGNAFDGLEGKITLVPTKNASTFTSTSSGEDTTAIYSKRDLTIKGDGSLTAVSANGNGIRTKKDLEIGICDLTVNAANHGIKGDQSVKITKKNNSVTVTAGAEGIKADQAEETDPDTGEVTEEAGYITINGGTLNITAGEDGIQALGNVTAAGGNITVNSQGDCIQADNMVNITGGTFDLTAFGGANNTTSTENSCKGVKGGVIVNINGGTFDIDTYDDAIHSNNTVRVSSGSITAASGDDGVHGDCYLIISGDAYIDVTKSYEGIEAAKIYVEGGETYVVSSDDGVNAAGEEPTEDAVADPNIVTASTASIALFAGFGGPGGGTTGGWGGGPNWGGEDSSNYGYLEISGGILFVEAEGDGLDSNGDALMSGGTVFVNGPTSGGNGVLDVGDSGNTFKLTGGTLIGAGTSDMAVTPSGGTQYYVVKSGLSQSAGSAFKLTDTAGEEIITYVPSKSYKWVLVSTPDMTSGSYTLTYGGSVTGGTVTGKGNYGLVTGGTFTGGTATTLNATK